MMKQEEDERMKKWNEEMTYTERHIGEMMELRTERKIHADENNSTCHEMEENSPTN